MKLNELIYNNNVTVQGFPAFKGLQEFCNPDGEKKILSTLSPAIMLEQGIEEYYYPVLQRNGILKTTQEVLDADLEAVLLLSAYAEFQIRPEDKVVIVSRHLGTIELMKNLYPNYIRVIDGNATENDLKDQLVVGTLPGTLAAYCSGYMPVTIENYNAITDGDISGEDLKSRLKLHRTIKVDVKEN